MQLFGQWQQIFGRIDAECIADQQCPGPLRIQQERIQESFESFYEFNLARDFVKDLEIRWKSRFYGVFGEETPREAVQR